MVPGEHEEPQAKHRSWLFIGIVIAAAVAVGGFVWWMADVAIQQNIKIDQTPGPVVPTKSTATPQIKTETVLSGLAHVWEVAFLPTKEMIFTERGGTVKVVVDGTPRELAKIEDVYVLGEGGLMGLAVDPDFTKNRFVYTCYNSSKGPPDVRVVRWRVKDDLSGLEDRNDIISGIPSNPSGRHSGCRIGFGPDGHLWVGTGDIAEGDTAVQPKSLGGKVLRVDRDGKAVNGNLGGGYDSRIYSYGHRNVQGLAFLKKAKQGVVGVSVEHGSSVDDEVNLLKPGNFGWAPPPTGYDERVPMTDKARFPEAVDALWSSGDPTQAPSGASFLSGSQWKAWDDALAVAFLKDQKLTIMLPDAQLTKITKEEVLFRKQFGRIRAATQGPDGNLYLGTTNGSGDQIIRVIPY